MLQKRMEKLRLHQKNQAERNKYPGRLQDQARAVQDLRFQISDDDLRVVDDFNIATAFENFRKDSAKAFMTFFDAATAQSIKTASHYTSAVYFLKQCAEVSNEILGPLKLGEDRALWFKQIIESWCQETF